MIVIPLLAGAVTGFLLSESEAGWWIANLLTAFGGLAGGYEHENSRSGAKRGALAGFMFGTGILLADAITAAGPVAETPPIVLFPLIAMLGGLGLGALGGKLRSRLEAETPG